ncbi:MAG: tetratricopeptide repeat protein [Halanaerobiales bacterium]
MQEEEYLQRLSAEQRDMYSRGKRALLEGELQTANKLFADILEERSDCVLAYNKQAIVFIRRDELEKAKTLLQKALNLNSEYVPALTNLGSLEKKKGNLERAEKLYQQALEVDPEYGTAYNNLAVIYRERGDYTRSVKYMKKARKYGSIGFAYGDRSFYKRPGCIFLLLFPIAIILFLVFV